MAVASVQLVGFGSAEHMMVLCLVIPRVYTGRGVDFRSLHRQQSHRLELIYALQKL